MGSTFRRKPALESVILGLNVLSMSSCFELQYPSSWRGHSVHKFSDRWSLIWQVISSRILKIIKMGNGFWFTWLYLDCYLDLYLDFYLDFYLDLYLQLLKNVDTFSLFLLLWLSFTLDLSGVYLMSGKSEHLIGYSISHLIGCSISHLIGYSISHPFFLMSIAIARPFVFPKLFPLPGFGSLLDTIQGWLLATPKKKVPHARKVQCIHLSVSEWPPNGSNPSEILANVLFVVETSFLIISVAIVSSNSKHCNTTYSITALLAIHFNLVRFHLFISIYSVCIWLDDRGILGFPGDELSANLLNFPELWQESLLRFTSHFPWHMWFTRM